MSMLIPSTEASRYLTEDNDWTAAEVEAFFVAYGTFPRTEFEWERAIGAYMTRIGA